jgi:hypothetical protein
MSLGSDVGGMVIRRRVKAKPAMDGSNDEPNQTESLERLAVCRIGGQTEDCSEVRRAKSAHPRNCSWRQRLPARARPQQPPATVLFWNQPLETNWKRGAARIGQPKDDGPVPRVAA